MSSMHDMSYANSVEGALQRRSHRTAWIFLLLCALLVAAFAWAATAVIEEVTSGLGRIVPAQQLQVAQSLEGGIVRDLLVREGDAVEQDQVLMRIDDTGVASKLGEVTQRRFALLAELARLHAEAARADTIEFPHELESAAPSATASERAAFEGRRGKARQEKQLLEAQVIQRQQEMAELEARVAKLDAQLTPLERELELNRRLSSKGNVS